MHARRPLTRLTAALLLCAAWASGCASGGRTVLISDDSPIRIGPQTTGRIYRLIDGAWRLSDEIVALPEGWYCVPPRFVAPGEFAP